MNLAPDQQVTFSKEVIVIVQCGRHIKNEEIEHIRETVETFSRLSRVELAHTICEHLSWYSASGRNKLDACLNLLSRLEAQGMIQLPERKKSRPINVRQPESTDRTRPQSPVVGRLSDIGTIELRMVQDKKEISLVNEYLHRYHYLGYKKPFGCHLRYLVAAQDSILGCMLFSGAAKAMNIRDRWIGWTANERLGNLGFIINNNRFLLFPWVKVRNLASHILGKVVKVLDKDWQNCWGYRPALLETFVDPKYFDGTCYRAANFKYLGMTSGIGLVRQGRHYKTSQKKIFVYPLVNNFRQILCSPETNGGDIE